MDRRADRLREELLRLGALLEDLLRGDREKDLNLREETLFRDREDRDLREVRLREDRDLGRDRRFLRLTRDARLPPRSLLTVAPPAAASLLVLE